MDVKKFERCFKSIVAPWFAVGVAAVSVFEIDVALHPLCPVHFGFWQRV